jgi:hypothetical protein
MRTTIRFEDALLRKAKSIAAASGKSLNDFIEDAVRVAVAMKPASNPAFAELPTFRGQGLLPGIDLDDTAALLDRMESDARYVSGSRAPSRGAARRGSRAR